MDRSPLGCAKSLRKLGIFAALGVGRALEAQPSR